MLFTVLLRPFIDNQGIVYPQAYPLISIGNETVVTITKCLFTCPTCREIIFGHHRIRLSFCPIKIHCIGFEHLARKPSQILVIIQFHAEGIFWSGGTVANCLPIQFDFGAIVTFAVFHLNTVFASSDIRHGLYFTLPLTVH